MLFDTHCHLHDKDFFTDEQAKEMLARAEKNDIKKRKSVLNSEKNNSLLMKSMNFTNRKNILRNKHRQNNAVTLSQNFDSIEKLYQYLIYRLLNVQICGEIMQKPK